MMKKILRILLILLFLNSCKKTTIEKSQNKIEQKEIFPNKKSSFFKNSTFDSKDLFGIWTTDINGPHADFELTKNYFYIVDFDGDGNRKYEINENKINIFHPDNRVETGMISKAKNDTLIIYWASGSYTTYVRWTN